MKCIEEYDTSPSIPHPSPVSWKYSSCHNLALNWSLILPITSPCLFTYFSLLSSRVNTLCSSPFLSWWIHWRLITLLSSLPFSSSSLLLFLRTSIHSLYFSLSLQSHLHSICFLDWKWSGHATETVYEIEIETLFRIEYLLSFSVLIHSVLFSSLDSSWPIILTLIIFHSASRKGNTNWDDERRFHEREWNY